MVTTTKLASAKAMILAITKFGRYATNRTRPHCEVSKYPMHLLIDFDDGALREYSRNSTKAIQLVYKLDTIS